MTSTPLSPSSLPSCTKKKLATASTSQDARTAFALKSGCRSSREYAEALASYASAGACAANLKARCGRCEVCLTTHQSGVPRRCLANRVAAAAAAGHSGAQVAARGQRAIGARLSVWWPLDEEWYSGSVTDFDPLRHRHTVSYDDGDVEIVALWAPNEVVSAGAGRVRGCCR